MTDDRDLSTKAATKAMRKIMQGALAHSLLIQHLRYDIGLMRYNEVAGICNAWWQEVMGRKPDGYRPMFEREMKEAAKLVNAAGGSMKQTKEGVWFIDPANNPATEFAPEESRIVKPN